MAPRRMPGALSAPRRRNGSRRWRRRPRLRVTRAALGDPQPGRGRLGGDALRPRPPEETGFVALHLWNVGDAGGPAVPDAYFVDMGTREAQAELVRIAERYIRPAIDASRAAGVPVFHVEPASIALKYDSVRHLLRGGRTLQPPPPAGPRPPEANPGWNRERASAATAGATPSGRAGRGCASWPPATPSRATR